MLRYLYSVIIFSIFQIQLFSQVAVNEIICREDSSVTIELYNNSHDIVNIRSINFSSDTLEISKDFQDFSVQPYELSLAELELSFKVTELDKVFVTIETDRNIFSAGFNGCILTGESAGRYPDFNGDFIIYNSSKITPGKLNHVPGILVKKSSKTKFSPRDSSPNAALFYNNYYWIFGGWDYNSESGTYSTKGNIWKSIDGLDWSQVNDKPPFTPYSCYVVFKNKMMVYSKDTVFISEDGLSWERHLCNSFYYENYRIVVFKNKLYMLSFNVRWESDDGINWTRDKTDFPWNDIRYLPALVSAGDRLWLYGGGSYNDVWTSEDGLHWIKLLDQAPWSPRVWFNYTFFDNKIWMIDGSNQDYSDTINFGNKCDFWYSSDGVNWNQLGKDSAFQNRHASFLWNDGHRVLFSSGFGSIHLNRLYNDVWELNAPISLTSANGLNEQTICMNTPLGEITYAITGARGAVVSGLPDGVMGSCSDRVLTISGKPTLSGTFIYTVTTTGQFVLPTAEGTITVKPAASFNLVSAAGTNEQMLCINTPLKNIEYIITNADGTNVSGLPEGIYGSYSSGVFTISGMPEKTGNFIYTITCSGDCGESKEQGKILVNNTLIYPNPTRGIITILNIGHFSLRILDITGRQIFYEAFKDDYTIFEKDFSNVFKATGEYLIILQDNSTNKTVCQKIVFIR
jgi:hypothetical protein